MVNAVSPVTAPEPPNPKNAAEAARQFEAILIAQMLHNARPDDEDSTTETMWDVAAQQFSKLLADRGGLGLTSLISRAL